MSAPSPEEIDSFLHREWNNARSTRRREDMGRLSMRAVDKCYREFALLGFTGFSVHMGDDGFLIIEGTPPRELPAVRS